MAGLLVIIIIILVFSRSSRLTEVGRGFGQAVRNFKKTLAEPDEIDVSPGKEKKPSQELTEKEPPDRGGTGKEDRPG